LTESAAAQNPTVKITRVSTQPDPSKVREFADDVRDGKFVLPIGRRMPLRDAAEAHVLGGGLQVFGRFGSSGRTRTYNPSVNSHRARHSAISDEVLPGNIINLLLGCLSKVHCAPVPPNTMIFYLGGAQNWAQLLTAKSACL
jgi:hypothetical protein